MYCNGAQFHGRRFNARLGKSKLVRFLWKKILGMPLASARWNPEDFKDPNERFIFASHPHGVASLHHIAMMCPAVFEGNSFESISPAETRRDLAASVISIGSTVMN